MLRAQSSQRITVKKRDMNLPRDSVGILPIEMYSAGSNSTHSTTNLQYSACPRYVIDFFLPPPFQFHDNVIS